MLISFYDVITADLVVNNWFEKQKEDLISL